MRLGWIALPPEACVVYHMHFLKFCNSSAGNVRTAAQRHQPAGGATGGQLRARVRAGRPAAAGEWHYSLPVRRCACVHPSGARTASTRSSHTCGHVTHTDLHVSNGFIREMHTCIPARSVTWCVRRYQQHFDVEGDSGIVARACVGGGERVGGEGARCTTNVHMCVLHYIRGGGAATGPRRSWCGGGRRCASAARAP